MTDILDPTEVIKLRPDGPPSRIQGVPDEVRYEGPSGPPEGRKDSANFGNISEPTLSAFPPAGWRNGIGIIVVPGGGWTVNMWAHEGLDVARWLIGSGYTAFVLKYRPQATDADQEAFESSAATTDANMAVRTAERHRPTASIEQRRRRLGAGPGP